MEIFHKKWKKYDEIQLIKNKMDLNIRKITNLHPPQISHINEKLIFQKFMHEIFYSIFISKT